MSQGYHVALLGIESLATEALLDAPSARACRMNSLST